MKIPCRWFGHTMGSMTPNEIRAYYDSHGGNICLVKCVRCGNPLSETPAGMPIGIILVPVLLGLALGTALFWAVNV